MKRSFTFITHWLEKSSRASLSCHKVLCSLADCASPTAWLAAVSILAASSLSVSASGFSSGQLNLDYSWVEVGYAPYGPGAAAIGSAGDLWNSIPQGNPNTPMSLLDVHGTATSVLWSVSSGGGVATPYVYGTYRKLFDDNCSFYTASLSGLTPGQQYRLYLYDTYQGGKVTVNGVSFTLGSKDYATVNSLTAGVDYDVHTVTADAAGTLAFLPSGTAGYLTSWQLVAVPEPSCLTLAVLGAATLLAYRRGKSGH